MQGFNRRNGDVTRYNYTYNGDTNDGTEVDWCSTRKPPGEKWSGTGHESGSGDRWNGTGSSKQMGIGPNNPIGDKVLSDQNKTGTGTIGPARKMPLDARIVGWAVAVPAFVFLLLGLLLVIGLADIPTPDTRPALFGTVSLGLEVQFGIYWFSIGLAGLFSAYGVRKGHKFGWWCLLILLIDGIFNDMVMLPRFKVSILTTTGISIVIIAWLIWRRRLYNIGGTS